MSRSIPEKLRTFVATRAGLCCEYCLMHQDQLIWSGQIDHIISIKHNGSTSEENLAYSCLTCNSNKGSDIATLFPPEDKLIRLFNPRTDHWDEHFYLFEGQILPKTEIGRATEKILNFNEPDRVLRRRILASVGKYPPQK